MRVLVTGATGFIGSYVVPALFERGHAVRVLARPSSHLGRLPAATECVRGRFADADDALKGVEGVVHLAGVAGRMFRRGHDPGDLRTVNIDGTRHVFEAARRMGVRRAVLVTSMWTVLRPELATRSAYLASRLESERVAAAACADGMEIVIVCPTFVVGAGDRGPNFPGALVFAAMRGHIPLIPPGGMTWIAVTDAAHAIVAALERGRSGARYVIGAEHLEYRDLFARVARAVGRPAPRINAPPLLRALAAVGDASLWVAGRALPVPLRVGVDLLSLDELVDCTVSWEELGRPIVAVDDALRDAVAWFSTHRDLG